MSVTVEPPVLLTAPRLPICHANGHFTWPLNPLPARARAIRPRASASS